MEKSGSLRFKRHEVSFEELEATRLKLRIKNPEYTQVKRFSNSRYRKVDLPSEWLHFLKKLPTKVTRREDEEFIIPRNFPIRYSKPIKDSTLTNKCTNEIKFLGSLRPYQEKFFNDNKGVLLDNDKTLVVPCGHGKTIMSLYITCKYQQKTLVLVPTNYLKNQWKSSCDKFVGDAVINVASSSRKIDWKSSDILIITLDLLGARYDELNAEGFFSHWGSVVLDEAHNLGAKSYHDMMDFFPAKYRTALSATYRRHDKMHTVLSYHFGNKYEMPLQFDKAELHQVNTNCKIHFLAKLNKTQIKHLSDFCEEVDADFDVRKDIFHLKDTDIEPYENLIEKINTYTKIKKAAITSSLKKLRQFETKPSFPLYDSYISLIPTRNRQIVSLLTKLDNKGRCTLVLGKRIDQLKHLNKSLDKRTIKNQLIISETNSEELGESDYLQKEVSTILGIFQLAKEGLDIERLDTLVILHPLKDTEQAIGRILRYFEGKPTPKVYYLCDNANIGQAIFKSSTRYIGNNAIIKEPFSFKELQSELNEET